MSHVKDRHNIQEVEGKPGMYVDKGSSYENEEVDVSDILSGMGSPSPSEETTATSVHSK